MPTRAPAPDPTVLPVSPGRTARSVGQGTGFGMATMRWIDHWVGLPACFLLGLGVALARRLGVRRSRNISGTRPLAVYKFFGLGSVIEATPLLRAIRQRYPAARLIFVTFAENETLARQLGLCTDIRVIRTHSPWRFVADVLREMAWLNRVGVEAVIDLEFFSKFSTLFAFLSGARIRVGFHLNDFWRYTLLTHPIYFNYFRHITDIYREAGRRLDVPINDPRLARLNLPAEHGRAVLRWLALRGWSPPARLVGINVNAGRMSLERRWPLDRFADVARALLERHADLWIVLVGAPAERAYTQGLLAQLPAALHARVLVAAGDWSFTQFVAALDLFALFITNDSGPMHLAAAQGTPLISLWGPGRPDFYAPRSPQHRVLYGDFPCSPCLYMFTTFEGMWCHHEGWCMREILPPDVLAAAEELLSTGGRSPDMSAPHPASSVARPAPAAEPSAG